VASVLLVFVVTKKRRGKVSAKCMAILGGAASPNPTGKAARALVAGGWPGAWAGFLGRAALLPAVVCRSTTMPCCYDHLMLCCMVYVSLHFVTYSLLNLF
jgi:hypothetical protein